MNTLEKLAINAALLSQIGCNKPNETLETYNSNREKMLETINEVFDQGDLSLLQSDLQLATTKEVKRGKNGRGNDNSGYNNGYYNCIDDGITDCTGVEIDCSNVPSNECTYSGFNLKRNFTLNGKEGNIEIGEGWTHEAEQLTGGARVDISVEEINYNFSIYSPYKTEKSWDRDFWAQADLNLFQPSPYNEMTSSHQSILYYPTIFDQNPTVQNIIYSSISNDEIDIGSNQDAEEIQLMLKAIETLEKILPSTLN